MLSDLAKYRIEVAFKIMSSGKVWQLKDERGILCEAESIEDYLELAQIMIDASVKMNEETKEN